MAPETHAEIVRIRVKPSELERWTAAADRERLTLSEWLRRAAEARAASPRRKR